MENNGLMPTASAYSINNTWRTCSLDDNALRMGYISRGVGAGPVGPVKPDHFFAR